MRPDQEGLSAAPTSGHRLQPVGLRRTLRSIRDRNPGPAPPPAHRPHLRSEHSGAAPPADAGRALVRAVPDLFGQLLPRRSRFPGGEALRSGGRRRLRPPTAPTCARPRRGRGCRARAAASFTLPERLQRPGASNGKLQKHLDAAALASVRPRTGVGRSAGLLGKREGSRRLPTNSSLMRVSASSFPAPVASPESTARSALTTKVHRSPGAVRSRSYANRSSRSEASSTKPFGREQSVRAGSR